MLLEGYAFSAEAVDGRRAHVRAREGTVVEAVVIRYDEQYVRLARCRGSDRRRERREQEAQHHLILRGSRRTAE